MVLKIDSSGDIWDTAANWVTNSTYVLQSGIRYFESDTGRFKIGSGASWASTLYKGTGMIRSTINVSTVTPAALNTETTFYSFTASEAMTVAGWLNLVNIAAGDTLIVRVYVNSVLHAYVAYTQPFDDILVYVRERAINASDVYRISLTFTTGSVKGIAGKVLQMV